MAMSDDIRSVRTFLGSLNLDTFNPTVLALACSNLDALAEQAEALENMPIAVGRMPHHRQEALCVQRANI